jgi:hypothetical protein
MNYLFIKLNIEDVFNILSNHTKLLSSELRLTHAFTIPQTYIGVENCNRSISVGFFNSNLSDHIRLSALASSSVIGNEKPKTLNY